MADIVTWIIAALGAAGGIVLGRLWGQAEGRRTGKKEAERDALEDTSERVERGRAALRDGRSAGDPAERLQHNDGRW